MPTQESPRSYGVNANDRAPLIAFMVEALRSQGCRIIHQSPPNRAPFRITFETPAGERMGIIAYAFLATFTPTKNRPGDEHTFQVKYGSKDGKLHDARASMSVRVPRERPRGRSGGSGATTSRSSKVGGKLPGATSARRSDGFKGIGRSIGQEDTP